MEASSNPVVLILNPVGRRDVRLEVGDPGPTSEKNNGSLDSCSGFGALVRSSREICAEDVL